MRKGRPRHLPPAFAIACLLLLARTTAGAQEGDPVTARGRADFQYPLFDDTSFYNFGLGALLTADFHFLPVLTPFAELRYVYQNVVDVTDGMNLLSLGAGVGFSFNPLETLQLRLDASGGLYGAFWGEDLMANYYASGRLGADWRVAPFLSFSAFAGVTSYLGATTPLLTAANFGIGATLYFSGFSTTTDNVTLTDAKLGMVFPVFYSYYDDHPFGSVSVKNGEEAEIRNVRVSFKTSEYMDQYKVCATYPSIRQGAVESVPLYAIFNDEVLTLTSNTRVAGEVKVEYTLFGSPREKKLPVTLNMTHRNAMTWDDDKKAAAFVSSTDPAALWFSRFITGIVRDRMRGDINKNLQYAIGIFEAENLFGINYVIDPNSSYSDKSSSEESIDYLQYPYQTLFYRGGDCDDLSILFTALLESVGIRSAFITIPGHIFTAFMMGMSEADAKANFFDPSLLIFKDGQAWVPVEITMIKEGFVKSWRVAAKEWADNEKTGNSRLYPMSESWKLYPAVGVPGVNPRFTLPDEVQTVTAFDESMNKLVARQMDPVIRDYKVAVQTDDSPEKANELGIQYGRLGMLKEAWTQFTKAATAALPCAWTNLGNVAFLRGDYELAITYFRYALQADPDDTAAILGSARCGYELETYDASDAAYADLKGRDPALAAQYGYLASSFGNEGRAWSYTERLQTTVWDNGQQRAANGVKLAQLPKSAPAVTATATNASLSVSKPAAAAQAVKAESAPMISEKPPQDTELEAKKAAAVKPAETAAKAAPPSVAELPKDKDLEAKKAAAVKPAETAAKAAPPVVAAKSAATAAKTEPSTLRAAPVEDKPKVTLVETAPEPARPEPAPIKAEPTPVQPEPAKVAAIPIKPEPEAKKPEPAAAAPATPELKAPVETTRVVVAPVAAIEKPAAHPLDAMEAPVAETAAAQAVKPADGKVQRIDFKRQTETPSIGVWVLGGNMALQEDSKALFAKLVTPLLQAGVPYRYTFLAQSRGNGWTGAGIHIGVRDMETDTGYGAGKSVLVWLTHDPLHFPNGKVNRLQLYQSTDDVDMRMKTEAVVPESIMDETLFTIDVDPAKGEIAVSLNGTERLRYAGFQDLGDGVGVVFRALDKAEFKDFRSEEMR